jgi:glucitol operon activator protein
MFESQTVFIVVALAAAWLLQIWMSTQQMRRFNERTQRMRRLGTHTAVGMSGNTYRRKTYAALAVDAAGVVTAAEQLSGFTVFARPRPVESVNGIHIDEVGRGEPPAGVTAKEWAAFDHAAEFIRKKLAKEAAEDVDGPGQEGGP